MYQLELVFWLLVCLYFHAIQCVLKHCGAHKHVIIYIYIYIIYIHMYMIQNNLGTPQLVGFACQLGCKTAH